MYLIIEFNCDTNLSSLVAAVTLPEAKRNKKEETYSNNQETFSDAHKPICTHSIIKLNCNTNLSSLAAAVTVPAIVLNKQEETAAVDIAKVQLCCCGCGYNASSSHHRCRACR